MSKKGSSFTEAISAPQALILIALVLIIFGVIFFALSAESSIDKKAYIPPEDLKLLNYLKTPMSFNNQETTLGEFIISSNEDNSKRQFLENELLNIVPLTLEVNSTQEALVLEIKFPDGRVVNSKTIFYPHREETEIISSISLPTKNQNEEIVVTLYEIKLIEIQEYDLPRYHENP